MEFKSHLLWKHLEIVSRKGKPNSAAKLIIDVSSCSTAEMLPSFLGGPLLVLNTGQSWNVWTLATAGKATNTHLNVQAVWLNWLKNSNLVTQIIDQELGGERLAMWEVVPDEGNTQRTTAFERVIPSQEKREKQSSGPFWFYSLFQSIWCIYYAIIIK